MKRYWHELSKEEQKELIFKKNLTVEELMKNFKQPDWCFYPEALNGLMGCWALLFGYVQSEEDCKDCDCYKRKC